MCRDHNRHDVMIGGHAYMASADHWSLHDSISEVRAGQSLIGQCVGVCSANRGVMHSGRGWVLLFLDFVGYFAVFVLLLLFFLHFNSWQRNFFLLCGTGRITKPVGKSLTVHLSEKTPHNEYTFLIP